MGPLVITSEQEAKRVSEYFGAFHDGFIKTARVTSGITFRTHNSWEDRPAFSGPEEELNAIFMWGEEYSYRVELVIHHFNYNWPREPFNRAIVAQFHDAKDISDRLPEFIGRPIYDLTFLPESDRLTAQLTLCERFVNDIDNPKRRLFTFAKAQLQETTWAQLNVSQSQDATGEPDERTRTD